MPLGRAGAFDAVLEPGELAESEDRGPTVALRGGAKRVGPIVLLDRSELLPRAEAEAELGLEPGRTTILVSLGQGAEVRDANARCLAHLARSATTSRSPRSRRRSPRSSARRSPTGSSSCAPPTR